VATLAGLNHDGITDDKTVNVALYPNPTKEAVNIACDDGLQRIEVYNTLGQQMDVYRLRGDRHTILNTSSYATGIYMLRLVTTQGVTTKQLVIR
jgi:hypothetical protein